VRTKNEALIQRWHCCATPLQFAIITFPGKWIALVARCILGRRSYGRDCIGDFAIRLYGPRYDPNEKFVWWPIKLSGIRVSVARLYVCTYVRACVCVCVGACVYRCDANVWRARAVNVNETARWMSYRYYFYRLVGNFAAHCVTALYWRKDRGKWRKMHSQKVTLEKALNINRRKETNNDPKKNIF